MRTIFVNSIYELYENSNLFNYMNATKGNTGNMVWHHYCKRAIDYDKEVVLEDILNNDFHSGDILVVPVSNNISPYESDFSVSLRKLLAIDSNVNIILIGLGIQFPSKYISPKYLMKYLPDSKKRFYRMIAERCKSIGVRGEITAECLHYIGIENTKIIGCPSFYSNMISQNISNIKSPSKNKVAFNYTGLSDENRIMKIARHNAENSMLIRQNSIDYPKSWVNQVNVPKTKMIASISDWETLLNTSCFTFSVGTRMHGNMISYLNGIPSLWIVHDLRTKELCECLKLPHIDINKLKIIFSIDRLISYCNYNKFFFNNCIELRKKYISFLEENNIKHKFKKY